LIFIRFVDAKENEKVKAGLNAVESEHQNNEEKPPPKRFH
jgi:hypothetical protein